MNEHDEEMKKRTPKLKAANFSGKKTNRCNTHGTQWRYIMFQFHSAQYPGYCFPYTQITDETRDKKRAIMHVCPSTYKIKH